MILLSFFSQNLAKKTSPETLFTTATASSVAIVNIFVFARSVSVGIPFVLNFVFKLVPFFIDGIEWSSDRVHEPISFSHTKIVTAWVTRHWHFTWVADWLRWADWFWLFAVPVWDFSAFGFSFETFLDLGFVDGFSGWYFDGFFDVLGVRNFHWNILGFFTLDLSADGFLFKTWDLTGDLDFFLVWNLNLVFLGSVGLFHDRFWWTWFADWLAWFASHWLAWLALVPVVGDGGTGRFRVSSEHVSDRLSESDMLLVEIAALVVVARHGARLDWHGAWGAILNWHGTWGGGGGARSGRFNGGVYTTGWLFNDLFDDWALFGTHVDTDGLF